ncbi:4221_t:CDS:2, partial [Dentiscutata heterogama]
LYINNLRSDIFLPWVMVIFCLVGNSELCEDVPAPGKDSADIKVDVTEEFLESVENEKHIQIDGI